MTEQWLDGDPDQSMGIRKQMCHPTRKQTGNPSSKKPRVTVDGLDEERSNDSETRETCVLFRQKFRALR